MEQANSVTYKALMELFEQHELMASAVEAHAVVCGLVCGGCPLDGKAWLPHLADLINDGFGLPSAVRQSMTHIYEAVVESLMSHKGVEMLLPPDDAPLDERIDALVEWSQAFLAGFGVVQQELGKASEELQEMVRDIANITQVSSELDQEDEENEAAFLVLYEHIKLGVMMAFEECGQRPGSPSVAPTLH